MALSRSFEIFFDFRPRSHLKRLNLSTAAELLAVAKAKQQLEKAQVDQVDQVDVEIPSVLVCIWKFRNFTNTNLGTLHMASAVTLKFCLSGRKPKSAN